MGNISKNLYALRMKSGLTSAQVSQIAGVDVVEYEKYECGIAEVPFELVSKLCSFYGVETVKVYNEELEIVSKQSSTSAKEEKSETKVKKVRGEMHYSKPLSIVSIVLAGLLSILFFVPIYSGHVSVNLGNAWYSSSYSLSMLEILVDGDTMYMLISLFTLLTTLYVLVCNILGLSVKSIANSKFTAINRFIMLGLNCLVALLLIITFCAGDIWAVMSFIYFAGFIALAVITTLFAVKYKEKSKSNK